MTEKIVFDRNSARRIAAGDLLAYHAAKSPDKTVLVFWDVRYSYAELNTSVNRLAHGLTEKGIGKGDHVAIMCHNCDLFLVSWLALMKIGALMIPINWLSKGKEIEYVVNHCNASMLIVEDILVADVQSIREKLNRVEHYVCINLSDSSLPPGWIDIESLISDIYPCDEPEVEISPDDPAIMVYTSGTEAQPKGVLISHLNLVISKGIAQYDLNYNRESSIIIGLPLFHLAALAHFFFEVAVGGKAVVLYQPDPQQILEITQSEKITHWIWVTTLYVTMLDLLKTSKYNLKSLKNATIFGSYISPTLLSNWRKYVPEINFISAYGLSECIFGTCISGKDLEQRPGSVGRPFLNTRLMIEGQDGEKLPSGHPGEIVLRSPNVMLGYYKDEEKTALALRSGWLHTGDIGKLDDDGYLYFVDRLKDMIKTGGENVASTDVEEAITQHPCVAEVAVIGLRHPKWQEAVVAVVVPLPSKTVSDQEIIDHCKGKLAGYKIPKKVFIRASLPKSNVGKILKRDLKDFYSDIFQSG